MSLSDFGKAAGKMRDATHKALGGKNASGLEHKVITAKGSGKVEVQAPDGFIVTGGGWRYPDLVPEEGIRASYPSPDGKTWTVEIDQVDRGGADKEVIAEFTAYAVCVRAGG
ncbi:hypothetical protein ABZ471_32975 [Streptomyces sp. NPDC005728]|uniref:hypothetical protein n=1 Tax=Streptomyces sp. NPDC005728 TaxID=3157054 RepID=UPI003402A8E6